MVVLLCRFLCFSCLFVLACPGFLPGLVVSFLVEVCLDFRFFILGFPRLAARCWWGELFSRFVLPLVRFYSLFYPLGRFFTPRGRFDLPQGR